MTKEETSFSKQSSRDIPNLDFLRTIAVLLVFVRHLLSEFDLPTGPLFQPQPLGIMGVMLFFVHTSLVLMLSLERTWTKTDGYFNALQFYIRRLFRIYPLSVLTVISISFILIPLLGASNLELPHLSLYEVLANIFLIQNIAQVDDAIGVLWSLPIEVQMYLVLPFLFVFAKRFNVSKLFYLWFVMLVVAGFCHLVKLPFSLLKYVPCFIPGIIAFSLWGAKKVLPFWVLPVSIVAMAFYYMHTYYLLGGGYETVLAYPICLLTGVILPFLKPLKTRVLAKASKEVATYSYGIYLTHSIWNRLVFNFNPEVAMAYKVVFVSILTWFSSMGLYYGIEKPFIKYGGKLVETLRKRRSSVTKQEVPVAATESAK